MAETLQIVINAKDNASGPIGNVKSSLGGLGSMAGTVAKGAVLGFAAIGAGAAALGIKAIGAGSDVEEMMGKFNVVFGDSAPQAIAALDEFGAAVGRNKFELRGMAASVQDTFVPMGFARDEAANLSVELSKLAVDVASFNNSSDAEVMAAFQSAIVGNHETLRQFGVVITQATLDQELLNMGIAGGVKEATEAEKVQARLNLIMAGTSDAHGDAARTAGSWANTMRGLKSTLAETTAEIGTQLLPVLTPLLQNFASFAREHGPQMAQAVANIIPKIVELAGTIQGWMETAAPYLEAAYAWLAEKIPAAVAAIKSVWDAFWPVASQGVADAWAIIGPALETLRVWLAETMPPAIETIKGAWADLMALFGGGEATGPLSEWGAKISEIITGVQTAWAALVEFFEPTIQRLKDAIGPMIESFEPMAGKFGELKEAAGKLIEALEPVIAIVGGVLVGAFNLLLEIVAAVMPDLGTLIGNFVDIAVTVIETLAGVITGLVDLVSALLSGDWAGAWEAAGGIVATLAEGIIGIVENIYENVETIIKALVTGIVNWFGNLGVDVPAKIGEMKAAVIAKWAEIVNVFSLTNLRMVGVNLIRGLADGIADTARNYLREKIESVSDWIPKWIKDRLGIKSPSRVFYEIGLNIIDGLINGIEGRTPEAIQAMAGVLSGIAAIFEGMAGIANMPMMSDIVGRVRAINEQLKVLVVVFTEFAAWSFNYGNVLPALADVASNTSSVVNALKSSVETLAALAELTLVSDLAERMRYVVEAMRQTVIALASFKSDSTLQEAASQAGALGVVAVAIADMAKAWEIVGKFKAGDLDVSAVTTFLTDFAVTATGSINDALARLPEVAENWTTGMAAMNTALSSIGNMATAWAKLKDFERGDFNVDSVVTWLTGMAEIVTRTLSGAAGRVSVGEGFADWAAGVGEALGLIADIAKAWETLQDFEWQPDMNTAAIASWLTSLAGTITWVLNDAKSKGKGNVGEGFDTWADGVVDAVKAIADIAKAWETLQDFKWRPGHNMGAIVEWLANLGAMATSALNEMRKKGWSNVGEGFDAWADGVTKAIGAIADIASAWETVREFQGKIGGAESSFDVQAVVNWLASFGAMAAEAMKVAQNNSNRTFGGMFDKFVSAVTSSVSALSGVIDFIGKLDAFEQGEDLPGKFQRLRYDFEDVLIELDKMRLAVQDYVTSELIKFAQDVGVLADGLSGAVRLLADMEAIGEMPDVAAVMAQLGVLIRAALEELGKQIGGITEETSDLIVAFGQAMGALMSGLKSALELALALPKEWKQPDPAMWWDFQLWVYKVFDSFYQWVNNPHTTGSGIIVYTDEGLKLVNTFATAMSALMSGLKVALELAIDVPKTWSKPDPVMWWDFQLWVYKVFDSFYQWVNNPHTTGSGIVVYTEEGLNLVNTFASAMNSLMSGLKAALELAIAVPKEWAAPDASIWAGFESWVMDVFSTFATWIQDNFSGPDSKAQAELVSAVAGAMGSLFSALGDALSLALAFPPDWTPPTNTSAFESFVMAMFTRFYDWINSTGTYEGKPIPFGKAGLDLVNAFGTAMGSLFGGMASALDVFKGLSSFLTPMDSQLDAFFAGVNKVMKDSYDFVKANMTSERLKLVTEFGNAMSALFSGMSSALSVFDTMYKAGSGFANWMAGAALTDSPFSRAMADFFLAITETLTRFKANVVNAIGTSWMPAATTFLGAVQQVFSVLGQALGLFKDIQSSGLPSTSALQNFVDAVINLFSRFATGIGIMPSQAGAAGSQTQSTLQQWQSIINNDAQGWYQTGTGFAGMLALGWRDGMALQIKAGSFMMTSTIQVTNAIKQAIKTAFGIASPSKVMQEYGNFVGMGLAIGIDSSLPSVQNAADKLAAAMGLPQLDSAANYAPVYTVRVEGDISVGGQQISAQTADSIANLIVKRYRLYA